MTHGHRHSCTVCVHLPPFFLFGLYYIFEEEEEREVSTFPLVLDDNKPKDRGHTFFTGPPLLLSSN